MTNIPNGEAKGQTNGQTNGPEDHELTTAPGVSRRRWLGGAALVGVGLACGLATAQQARAQSKMKQADAKYVDKAPAAEKCSGCALFAAPDACNAVEGKISPDGWCSLYSAKT